MKLVGIRKFILGIYAISVLVALAVLKAPGEYAWAVPAVLGALGLSVGAEKVAKVYSDYKQAVSGNKHEQDEQ